MIVMKRIVFSFFILTGIFLFFSCKQKKSGVLDDTPTSGSIQIGVDETLAPIIRSEIEVFESIYYSAKIKDIPCPEVDAFNLLLKDSVRMIVATRTLTVKEKEYFNNLKIFPKEVKIALDGIALIVHKENSDTMLTTSVIQDIFVGKIKTWDKINPDSKLGAIKVIFDNPNSSTAEYAVKTICNNQPLSAELSALNNNLDVIDFVAKTPNALGIIGVNWISNQRDTTCMGFLDKIKVIAVSKESTATVANSFQPFQAYLANGQYAFTRNVYVILADPRIGLTSGFTSFITGDRGQRIILKSGILPVTQPVRIIHVNEEL
jgi:phosphate transport system substrate-binding protein